MEPSTKFHSFLEAVKINRKSQTIEEEKSKILNFLKSLSLNLLEFPDDAAVLALFEANLCMKNKSSYPEKKWKKDQTILLVWIIYYMIHLRNLKTEEELEQFWGEIAEYLRKNPIDCVFKYYSLKTCQIQKKAWTEEESNTLSHIVRIHKSIRSELRWCQISREFYQTAPFNVFRSDKACREHWISHLDPTLNRKPWTKTEDNILMEEFLIHGSKWTVISEKLKGKNVFSVKNRFYQLIKKFNDAKIHEAMQKTLDISNESERAQQKGNPMYQNVNAITQTLENHQINLSPFILQNNGQNYYQTQPNAFLVVPIILPNIPSQQMQTNLFDSNSLAFENENENQSEIFSVHEENNGMIKEGDNDKDSIDKFFAF